MSDNIPFEIQTEIIKRVYEVKSLIRFRSVSKPWKSFIDSSEFIAGFRPRKTQPRRLILRYHCQTDRCLKYLSVNDTFTQRQDFTPNVSALMKQLKDTIVFGSSGGLFCLYALGKGMLVVWNPSIRRSVGLVAPYIFDVFGFGVCPVTNDPTVVKISFPWKVQVFSFNSKRWSVIQCSKFCESIQYYSFLQVVIGSCIYRLAFEDIRLPDGFLRTRHMIVSFDLVSKEFRAIDLPDDITKLFLGCVHVQISKLRGSLVVIVPMRDVNVWKMEGDFSFTKLFTINTPDLSIRNILRFNKNNELVIATQEGYNGYDLFGGKDSALEVYDRFSQHMNNLEIHGQPDSFFISSYMENYISSITWILAYILILIDHGDGSHGARCGFGK